MGTTSNLQLPYPEGSDLVIAGDDAIEALAARLDYVFAPDASVAVAEGESAKAVAGATPVDFPGTLNMNGFTVNAGLEIFTHTGANRFFMVSASVEVDTGAVSTATFSSTVTLLQNGSVIDSGHDLIISSAVDFTRRRVVHKVATPVQLGPGDTIAVTAYSDPAGTLGLTSLRIFPMGPKL